MKLPTVTITVTYPDRSSFKVRGTYPDNKPREWVKITEWGEFPISQSYVDRFLREAVFTPIFSTTITVERT